MRLPPRVYFTLHEAAARWGCAIADLAHWADLGKFRIVTGIRPVHCDTQIVAGKVVLPPLDLLPLFRRCGTGPPEGMVRRVQPLDRQDWLFITDPAEGIPVATVDMLIPAEEVHAFEDEHEMVRRVAGGQGSASPYDWDGMMIALIQRIHDHGLPATQSELVAEMQDWFAERSNGAKMPDSRSIRRRITPIWRSLHQDEA